MEKKAKLSYLRIAPRKVRLVADLVRGKDIEVASEQLQVLSKRAALPILKLIRAASAEAGGGRMYIKAITVDQGPVYKRFRPRARGKADVIKKMTSHVNLEIASYPEKEVVSTKKETKKVTPAVVNVEIKVAAKKTEAKEVKDKK